MFRFGKNRKELKDEIEMLDQTIRGLTAGYCTAVQQQRYDEANRINTMLTEATAKRSALIAERYKGGVNKSDVVCTVIQGLIAAGGSAAVYFATKDRIIDKATERTSKSFLDFFRRKNK